MTLRVYSKEAEIAAVTAKFNVNATSQTGGVFGDEEFALCHVGANAFGVDAVAFDEGLLDTKSSVDENRERIHVISLANANA